MSKTYRIGDLATQLAVPVETIRYYEREGLLPQAARSAGNYRLYGEAERTRLEFVLHCRALDMTLQEIRHLLQLRDSPEQGCEEVNVLLDSHISHVSERIRALRSLQSELKSLRMRCEQPETNSNCGILRELASSPLKVRTRASSAVHSSKRGL